ncbi:MAG: hypothetical protein KKF46_00780 [Nanoarchaeota archaeon]|nr:hypothetical protein [Nanoarchaeota archaeon]
MEEAQKHSNKIKKKHSMSKIRREIDKFRNLKVLVIGDTILDQYVFVWPKGRAIKDPILSTEYKYQEVYPGGILAIANHISNFVNKVKLVSIVGDKNSRVNFISKSLNKNVDLKTFTKKNSHTTVKKRYIDYARHNKLFKVEYMNDKPITNDLSNKILRFLDKEIQKYDLVVVGDFGHGFINNEIRKKLGEKAKFLALNSQSNSANMGYNYFNLYDNPSFVSTSEDEFRLPLSRRFEPIEDVVKEGRNVFKLNSFLVTLGKHGCIFVNKDKIFKAPVLTSSVKDTVGAGDALYAIAALCVYSNVDDELVPFIANCAGGIAANIMGNKESVTKESLLQFVKDVLK